MGMVLVPFIHLSVYLFRTLHPQPVVLKPSAPSLPWEMLRTLLVSVAAVALAWVGSMPWFDRLGVAVLGADARVLQRIMGWREICPDIAIRSTFVVGFPGETADDFEYLLDWLAERSGNQALGQAARRIEKAVDVIFQSQKLKPFEFGGSAGTQAIRDADKYFLNSCGVNDVVAMIEEGVMICTGGTSQAAQIGRLHTNRQMPW